MAKKTAKSKDIPGMTPEQKMKVFKELEENLMGDIIKNGIAKRFREKHSLPDMILTYKTQGKGEAKVGKQEIDNEKQMIENLGLQIDDLRVMLGMVRDEMEKLQKSN